MKHIFILLIFINLSLSIFAQSELISRKQACQFEGENPKRFDEAETIYGFSSTPEAEEVVNRILAVVYSNMKKARFVIRAADVPNAEAVVEGDKKLILYNADFMLRADKNGDWVSVFILAHEIGHHFLGHTLSKDGSRPTEELDADEWAGSIMCGLGATLDQAQLAIQTMVKDGQPRPGSTHPPKSARIQAISVGFANARCKAGGNPDVNNPVPPKPVVVNDPNEANYQSFKKQGDAAFTQEKWRLAKSNYTEALSYKSSDSYCKSRIATCEQKIVESDDKAAEEERRSLYAQYKNDGDSYYGRQQWQQAKDSYKKALDYSAGDSYCTQRIASCNEKLTEKPKPDVKKDLPEFVNMVRVEGANGIKNFYIGTTEVTQKQWKEIMGNNPSSFKDCEDCPVERVSWNDIQSFLQKLNAKYPNKNYRLPTEAEWEFAAKGGKNSNGYTYAGSSDLGAVGWYSSNSGSKTHPVGQKGANELGIYDMSGNVWEWCEDLYSSNGSLRVIRGGSWCSGSDYCTASSRDRNSPTGSSYHLGFRLSRTE